MVKRGTLAFILFALVLLSPVILAEQTTIKIKTVPFANLNIILFDTDSENDVLYQANQDADKYGDFEFTHNINVEKFDISIYVKKNNQKVFYDRFFANNPGEDLNLLAAPDDAHLFYAPNETVGENKTQTNNKELNESNETVEENTTLQEQKTQTKDTDSQQGSGITGLATSDDTGEDSGFSSIVLYFVLGFLVLGTIIVTGALKLKKMQKVNNYGNEKPPREVKVKKLSEKLKEIKEEKSETKGEYSKAIQEAEEKIKFAQKELNKLKNAERIKDLKSKIEDQKKELEKLEDGND